MTPRAFLMLSALAAPLALAALPARAQVESREGIALQNQILELRHDIQQMQNRIASGGGSQAPAPRSAPVSGGSNDLTAQLLSRVNALEEEVRQLRGRTDELANQQQVQAAQVNKQIGDLAFQIGQAPGGKPAAPALGSGIGPASALGAPPVAPGASPPMPSVPPVVAPVGAKRTPELAIQDGNAALARRDYAAAEALARDVLANNRTSPRAYDAQYLLAEALSGKRDYSQAAIAYDDAYRRSPKGVHAPDSLLGLANALTAINEKRAACDTLNQFRSDFPTPRADLKDAVGSARQRAGCK